MIIQELRERIAEYNEEAIVFDNPSFDRSIVGMSDTDCVIYDYDKMVEELMEDDKLEDPVEAMEFIDYNTIRSLSYAGQYAPIILYKNDFDFYSIDEVANESENPEEN